MSIVKHYIKHSGDIEAGREPLRLRLLGVGVFFALFFAAIISPGYLVPESAFVIYTLRNYLIFTGFLLCVVVANFKFTAGLLPYSIAIAMGLVLLPHVVNEVLYMAPLNYDDGISAVTLALSLSYTILVSILSLFVGNKLTGAKLKLSDTGN